MSTVPAGWRSATLAEVAKWGSGGTPSARDERYYGGNIPWAVIGDLNDGVVTSTTKAITAEGLDSSSAKWVPAGSVLIAMYGSIGKLGIAGVPLTTNQAIAFAVPGPDLDGKFLFYYLLSQRRQLDAQGKGATQRNISQTILKPWPIPVPTLEEQRQIVEILEDHLSNLDAATLYESDAMRRVASLRNELVRRAITGAHLDGPRHHAALGDVGTHDGQLAPLPDGWAWRRLGEIADVVGGVTKDAKKQNLPGLVEVPYLRVANVQRGALRLNDVSTIRVSQEKADALSLKSGDVLMNEGGDRDKLARGWVWEGEIAGCIHQNHVFRARLRNDLDPYFLSWTANTIGGRWAEQNGKQSVNLASISLSMIRRMPVVVPPSGVSSQIVERLKTQIEEIDRLEQAILDTKQRSMVLRRAVLSAAFEGKLTRRHTDAEVIEEMAVV